MGKDKKSNFKHHFRRGKSANHGHPTYVCGRLENELKYIGLTHADITDGVRNIKLDKNPNPNDKRNSYIRPKTESADLSRFGRKLPHWKFCETDKGKVEGVIKKDKDKRK